MSEEMVTLKSVKDQLDALAESHAQIAVRATALQAMVGVLAWGIGKSREEVAQRVLDTGKKSLPGLQGLPPKLEKEVSSVFNTVYSQVLNEGIEPESIGLQPV